MIVEPALPTAQEATASGQPENAELLANTAEDSGNDEQQESKAEEKPKAEKTAEQIEVDRLRKGIDRKTRQREEARAEAHQLRQELSRLRGDGAGDKNATQQDDEPLTLSRAELAQMVKSEAEKLAPTLKQQSTEIEHQSTVANELLKDLGKEKYTELIVDLDEAVGGLDRNGKTTPVYDAIFTAEDPQAVIKYLADPDNADEAEAIGRLDPIRAGRAIAKLEGKIEQAKAESKPQRSNAPEPIEPSRGGGSISSMPDPKNVKAYIKWANEQDRRTH